MMRIILTLLLFTLNIFLHSQTIKSKDAQLVQSYLECLSDDSFNGVIVGQNCGHGTEIEEKYDQYIEKLFEKTGKYVGIIGIDYEYMQEYTREELKKVNQYLVNYWNKGGLVEINMTPKCPYIEGGNVYNNSGNDLKALIDSTTTIMCKRSGYENLTVYEYWIGKLNRLADALTQLRDSGVVVLWRPMQEPNADHDYSFWYAKAYNQKEDFIALWKHFHNYFNHKKSLNNLLWVYSPIGGGNNWGYAGDEYVDIIAGTTYGSDLKIWGYPALKDYNKPKGMGEFGPGIDKNPGTFDLRNYIKVFKNDYPDLAFWISWHSWNEKNKMAIIDNQYCNELMNDTGIITLEKLSWKESTCPSDITENQTKIKKNNLEDISVYYRNNRLFLRFPEKYIGKNTEIRIIDNRGRLIQINKIQHITNFVKLSSRELESGCYYSQIWIDGKVLNFSFFVY